MAANAELAALRVEITSNIKAIIAEVTQLRAQVAELQAQVDKGGGVEKAASPAAIARIKEAGKSVRGVTSAFTGLTATAGAAAGAILSVADAVAAVIDFIEAMDGSAAANNFIAGLKTDGENAGKSLEALRDRIIEVEGEIAAVNENPLNPFGRFRGAIEEDLERLREFERSLSRQVEAHKRQAEELRKVQEAKENQADLDRRLLELQREANDIERQRGSESDRINAEADAKIDYLEQLRDASDQEAFRREIDRIRAIHEERRRLMLEEIKERDEEERRLAADRAAENARAVEESLKRAIEEANRDGNRLLGNIEASGSRLEALLHLIAINTGR